MRFTCPDCGSVHDGVHPGKSYFRKTCVACQEIIDNFRTQDDWLVWVTLNPERAAEVARNAMRNWQKNNPEKCRLTTHNYRARKMGNGGTHTIEEEYELFSWQQGRCHYCNELLYSSYPYQVDHKLPVSRGGSNDISNIALACADCNRKKHTKTEEEFLKYISR